jgi:hypothetical protein
MKSKDMALYMKNRRASRRSILINMYGASCRDCKSVEQLEFNHIDRSKKSFTLSGRGLDGNWDIILEELSKCELLCRPCHIVKTKIQYETKQIRQWNDKKSEPLVHGTARSYQEQKCKCNDCKLAKKYYRAKQLSYWQHISEIPL